MSEPKHETETERLFSDMQSDDEVYSLRKIDEAIRAAMKRQREEDATLVEQRSIIVNKSEDARAVCVSLRLGLADAIRAKED